ncbi:MAG: ComF family protein [Candidatus Berkelbacteria bacterium]
MSNFKFSINEIKLLILDFLFPKYCVNCGSEVLSTDGWVCFECTQKIVPVVSQICPECEKLSPMGEYHSNCRKGKSLKGIICSTYFHEGPVREMIHNLKYNGVSELAAPLARLMERALEKSEIRILNDKFDVRNSDFVITYVPMHNSRKATRGYNHAEILAREIGQKLNIKVEDLLIKKSKTRRQAELSGNARRKNLSGAFAVKPDICIKNCKIIIVDDVTTTGSTLNECAKVLKTAGAKEIWGLVIARG